MVEFREGNRMKFQLFLDTKDETTTFISITLTELIQHNALVHRGNANGRR